MPKANLVLNAAKNYPYSLFAYLVKVSDNDVGVGDPFSGEKVFELYKNLRKVFLGFAVE